jgi:2'-5' RNA ligase
MHGLVSLLPQPYFQQVEALWQELETTYHLHGIQVTPLAHFSWQIAQDYDFDNLEAIIRDIAARTSPFVVRTTGLGLFTGFRPVLFIPVVKDANLVKLHAEIWEQTRSASQGQSLYYDPEHWMPHISLAYEDIDAQNIGPILQALTFRTFDWEMTIDNIALIYEPEGEIGRLKFTINLTG